MIFAQNWARQDSNAFGSSVGSDVNDLDAFSDIDRNGIVENNDLSLFTYEWLWNADDLSI